MHFADSALLKMTENNANQQDSVCISRADLNAIFEKAAKKTLHKEAVRIGQALAGDLQDALSAINDELGRFADRLKSLEAWAANHEADAKTREVNQHKEVQAESKKTQFESKNTIMEASKTHSTNRVGERTRQNRNETEPNRQAEETEKQHIESDTEPKTDQAIEDEQGARQEPIDNDTDGWTRVTRKKKRNKVRQRGAVLIGGQNVSRIKAAALDEFNFDQNVSFVAVGSEEFNESLHSVTQRSKAKQLDVVIHSGAEDAVRHGTDDVLEKLTNMVEYARGLKAVDTVSVCSLEERRDAGLIVCEKIRTINTELAQLCLSTGSNFIDLRPRLNESLFGGINRTGILYTFEGARNVAQHILAETAGFLD